jgi:hypothetical protein
MMYEGANWCDHITGKVPHNPDDWSCFQREFDSGGPCDEVDPDIEPTDWEALRTLTEQIAGLADGAFYPEVEAFFDFDRFLSMWAVEGVLAHWDGYSFTIVNNYRVYHERTSGLWTMMPWGIDQTFAGDLDPWETSAGLVARCLAEPDCEAAFAARQAEMATLFDSLDFVTEAETIHALISDSVAADPRREYDFSDWQSWHDDMLGWIAWRSGRVREILASHGF